ncbi:septation ring formation regulator EzrA [Secundilactobacillus malefermentans]|uniref:septation ring formation regulator EzrA n=1 Tax=Secundilactobacillus malefermentans TaxID=176292 RepID=UPI0011C828A4|nr:septation ring formation regulator EzrA [Secundilactobacillus malefermentans]QEA32180.1 septation ring formation regulator EzrA [Secundilactobacillus malefermentans]
MIRVLVGIIVLAIVIYIGVLAYQHHVNQQLKELRDRKEKLDKESLSADIKKANRLSLTGKSLQDFNDLQKSFEDIDSNREKQFSEQLEAGEAQTKNFQIFAARETRNKLAELVTVMEQEFNSVKTGLADLQEIDRQHRQAVSDLESKYQEIRKTLLAKNFSYGPSIDKLEDMLSGLEADFDDFSKFTSEGDHEHAESILESLRTETGRLEELLSAIPDLYKDIATEFPAQLTEIKTGSKQMMKQHFNFPKMDFEQEIAGLGKQIETSKQALEGLKIEDASAANARIEKQIDRLYAAMETEYQARGPVEENLDVLSRFIAHAQNQNRVLLRELERLNQNYTLDHDEVATARGLTEQLKQINDGYQLDIQSLTEKSAVYSEILKRQEKQKVELTQIEKQQTEINDSVSALSDEEKKARETLQRFDFEMHSLKRNIENLNLPGLPKDYLDYFFVVSDEVDKLADAIGQVQINMEEITKQLIMIQSDLDTLKEKSTDLRDSAKLAEQLIQYANRFRLSKPEIETASQKAKALFDREYKYTESLETIATALDKVEPGSYKRLEDSYYKSIQTK